MHTIIVFVADDGSRFDDEEACDRYEQEAALIAQALSGIGPRLELRSNQCRQHTRAGCFFAREKLIEEVIKKRWSADEFPCLRRAANDIDPRSSFIGRLIDDGGGRALKVAWFRLICIDWETFREYSQPYFANNPNEALERV